MDATGRAAVQAVQWGVLGAARIAEGFVIPAIQRAPGASLRAVASRRPGEAERLSARFGAPRAYGDYAGLLDDPGVEAVYIALPNALHARWALAALAAGKQVLCEKPLACSVAEADEIAAAAEAAGRLVAEAFMYRYHPQFTRLLELIFAGAIGRVRAVRGVLSFVLGDAGDIRMSKELGGGARLDLGCYVVDAAVAVFGGPPVAGSGVSFQAASGADVHTVGVLAFADECTACVEASFRLPWLESRLQVCGELGMLTLPHAFNPGTSDTQLIFTAAGSEPQVIDFRGVNMYERMLHDFMVAARGGPPGPRGLADSRAVQEGLEFLLGQCPVLSSP